jgi:hypothetical protein
MRSTNSVCSAFERFVLDAQVRQEQVLYLALPFLVRTRFPAFDDAQRRLGLEFPEVDESLSLTLQWAGVHRFHNKPMILPDPVAVKGSPCGNILTGIKQGHRLKSGLPVEYM